MDHHIKPATRGDVAKRAGVSTAVVSYVLNNGPRSVATATKEKVLRAIEELGYSPNAVARALKVRRTNTLGLIVPDIGNPYFAELSKAIEDSAFARGYSLVVGNSSNEPDRERMQIDTFRARQVDGLLLVRTMRHSERVVSRLDGLPTVVLDRIVPGEKLSSVIVDNFGGAYAAVKHLIDHGHRAIACIGGPTGAPLADERVRGWMTAMAEEGLPTKDLSVRGAYSRRGGYELALALLERKERPSAVFASSDLQGVGVLRACYEKGVRVPDDLAVFAFDGTSEAAFTAPPLSVVQQDLSALAESAVSLVLSDLIAASPVHHTAPFELVPRRSCGC